MNTCIYGWRWWAWCDHHDLDVHCQVGGGGLALGLARGLDRQPGGSVHATWQKTRWRRWLWSWWLSMTFTIILINYNQVVGRGDWRRSLSWRKPEGWREGQPYHIFGAVGQGQDRNNFRDYFRDYIGNLVKLSNVLRCGLTSWTHAPPASPWVASSQSSWSTCEFIS